MELSIEKLVFGGQGIAHADGKTFFVWNALPEERVEVEIIKKRKGIREAVATRIVQASPHRIAPREEHYLSCSPWQILSIEQELQLKVEIARETVEHIGHLVFDEQLQIVGDIEDREQTTKGYRNKMEFSFWETDEDNVMHLSLFERGKKTRMPIEGCLLAEPIINTTAKEILSWVRTQGFGRQDLKTLIVRSNGGGEAAAALFLKRKPEISSLPDLSRECTGFSVYYSDPRSPASVATQLLAERGTQTLSTILLNAQLQFGLLGFFQINLPLFEAALRAMKEFIPAQTDVVDLYSGVGAISIPLASRIRSAILVDTNAESIQFAQENIRRNHHATFQALCTPAEQLLETITSDRLIILDPPRAGLHTDVTQRILDALPQRLMYLSCNVATQARDIALLSQKYCVSHLELYNFFPHTPHIEALCFLERR